MLSNWGITPRKFSFEPTQIFFRKVRAIQKCCQNNYSRRCHLLQILTALGSRVYWHDLDRGIAKSSPRDCKMTFNIGRGCAELQYLKKWKWPNWVDYCDETLHTHWYWQDAAQEIVKYHLGLAEALPRFKFWKTVKLALSLEPFGIFW